VVLAPDDAPRGAPSNRDAVGEFELSAQAVIIASGGIGANHEIARRYWPERMGTPPRSMITGVPAHVDGRMLDIAADAGVRLVNRDRMWHYTEGIQNWNPIWHHHAIRILPGPSSMWFDAVGRRLPEPYLPGYDTLGTLRYLRTDPVIAGYDHSWFILTQKIIEKEFALSGSEQNPDITSKSRRALLRERVLSRSAPGPVEAFKRHGADFVVANDLESLVAKMNTLTDEPLLVPVTIRGQIKARDLQMANPFAKDAQVQGIRNARRYLGDRIGRVAAPHRVLDPAAGPLIGVKLHILTRKTLGGIRPTCRRAPSETAASPSRASMRSAKPPDSAVAVSMATTPWKARSSAAASSPDAPPRKPFNDKAPGPAISQPVSFDARTSR
jgi:uncharacterized protein